MRKIESLLEEYGESHQNPVNKAIHWIAVPVIVWTVVGLLWSIPFPWDTGIEAAPVNWATLVLLLAQLYWFRLSPRLGLGLLLFSVFLIQATVLLLPLLTEPLWKVSVIVFIAAWVLQFIGHAVEGKRPSFFRDVQFLLVGPAWLMAFVYRALGFRY